MARVLEEFDIPVIDSTTTWRQVFSVYDKNFIKLHQFLRELGTKFKVKEFTGLTGREVNLDDTYVPGSNQLMVYKNNVIQWKNTDYREDSTTSIEMTEDLVYTDEVKVVIVEIFSRMTSDRILVLDELPDPVEVFEGHFVCVGDGIYVCLSIDGEFVWKLIQENAATLRHNALIGRNDPNSHSIGAISGLREELDSKASVNFVNSSIATNTATFRGTYNSLTELMHYTGSVTNNDYAYVKVMDPVEPEQVARYDRYKWVPDLHSWEYEFSLNNSSFTQAQWDAINSGITTGLVGLIGTALQPSDLNVYRTADDQDVIDEGKVLKTDITTENWVFTVGGVDITKKVVLSND